MQLQVPSAILNGGIKDEVAELQREGDFSNWMDGLGLTKSKTVNTNQGYWQYYEGKLPVGNSEWPVAAGAYIWKGTVAYLFAKRAQEGVCLDEMVRNAQGITKHMLESSVDLAAMDSNTEIQVTSDEGISRVLKTTANLVRDFKYPLATGGVGVGIVEGVNAILGFPLSAFHQVTYSVAAMVSGFGVAGCFVAWKETGLQQKHIDDKKKTMQQALESLSNPRSFFYGMQAITFLQNAGERSLPTQ